MRVTLITLMLLLSSHVYADDLDDFVDHLYNKQHATDNVEVNSLEINAKKNKMSDCVDNYIRQQSKAYNKTVKKDLYNLMRNFDKITSKIHGKQNDRDSVPYEQKIETLGKIQCKMYFDTGVLK